MSEGKLYSLEVRSTQAHMSKCRLALDEARAFPDIVQGSGSMAYIRKKKAWRCCDTPYVSTATPWWQTFRSVSLRQLSCKQEPGHQQQSSVNFADLQEARPEAGFCNSKVPHLQVPLRRASNTRNNSSRATSPKPLLSRSSIKRNSRASAKQTHHISPKNSIRMVRSELQVSMQNVFLVNVV